MSVTTNESEAPLDGLRVLDFSTLLPGPLAGLMLAESGADVIKIEPPGGDALRRAPPFWGGMSALFALLNRGKKSVSLDLKTDQGRQAVMPLVKQADILIEQFRPGVMDRLGLGYERLALENPALIYCSITGYGQAGPKAGNAGHDLNFIAEAGILSLSPGPADAPVIPPVLSADIAGGSYPAVMNILLALMERGRTGHGRHLDISMSDNLFTLGCWGLARGFALGDWPGANDGLLTGASPRYQLYPTSEGRLLAVAAIEDRFWAAFCEAIDLPEQLRDDKKDPEETRKAIRRIIAGRTGSHWGRVFENIDCCCTLVKSLEGAVFDPHFQSRQLFEHKLVNAEGDVVPALPLPLATAFRGSVNDERIAPQLGQHNDELLGTQIQD